MTRFSCVVVTERSELVSAVEQSGQVTLKAVAEGLPFLEGELGRHAPDVVVVDLEPDPAVVLHALEGLPEPRPALVVCGPDDSRLILRAMRLGAREYVAPSADLKDELVAALERTLHGARPGAAHEARRTAPLLAVMGAKGGVGTTFVSCQLAAGLAHRGGRVVIADGHLRLGDVALYFDVHPRYTMASLSSAGADLDAAYLQTVLAPHRSGVQVLAAPEQPEAADTIGLEQLDRALSLLRRECDWLVVDTPREFDERSVHLLDRASQIVLVTTCDVPALNHTRLQLDLLRRLGHSPHKVHVAVNRMDRRVPLQRKEVDEFLRRKADLYLPNDYPSASGCVNEGRPLWELTPRSALRGAMDELVTAAHAWCGVAVDDRKDRPRRLLGLIKGK